MASEAQRKSIQKYLASKVEVRFWTTPEIKEKIQEAAQEVGQSVASYILETLERRMAEDQKKNHKP